MDKKSKSKDSCSTVANGVSDSPSTTSTVLTYKPQCENKLSSYKMPTKSPSTSQLQFTTSNVSTTDAEHKKKKRKHKHSSEQPDCSAAEADGHSRTNKDETMTSNTASSADINVQINAGIKGKKRRHLSSSETPQNEHKNTSKESNEQKKNDKIHNKNDYSNDKDQQDDREDKIAKSDKNFKDRASQCSTAPPQEPAKSTTKSLASLGQTPEKMEINYAFDDLPIHENTKKVIKEKMCYTKMTEVQARCIPVALSGADVLGAAKTGSGEFCVRSEFA